LSKGLYLYTYKSGFNIYDISDPYTPTLVGSYSPGSNSFFVDGNYVYLIYSNAMDIVSIADPANPVRVARFPLTNQVHAEKVKVYKNYAYLIDPDNSNIWIIKLW